MGFCFDLSQIHFAVQEVENGAHWLIEQAKIGLAEEIVEETADKIIITRHTPLGEGFYSMEF